MLAEQDEVEEEFSTLSSAFTNPENKALPHRLQVTQTNMRSTKSLNRSSLRQEIPSWLPQIDPPQNNVPTSETPSAEYHEESTSEATEPCPPEAEPHTPIPPAAQANTAQSPIADVEMLKDLARQAIEEVAWEVLPDLVAEVVRSELERAKREEK